MKKVAILQSNYIPWKGYFDIINEADVFIFYDDVQYTKQDWRNRNKIKTPNGTHWLTVPVGSSLNRMIYEVEIKGNDWSKKHWKTIKQFYLKAPYFKKYQDFFEHIYLEKNWENLSNFNQYLIRNISKELLGINTKCLDSRDFKIYGNKTDRLIELTKAAKGNLYISGPSAKNYLEEKSFFENNIKLFYKDYSGYPHYRQLYASFDHYVSIIDLLFNVGPEAPYYIWGWREENF